MDVLGVCCGKWTSALFFPLEDQNFKGNDHFPMLVYNDSQKDCLTRHSIETEILSGEFLNSQLVVNHMYAVY